MIGRITDAAALENLRAEAIVDHPERRRSVTVCGGTGCQAAGCAEVGEALRAELAAQGLTDTVKLVVTGCNGFCEQGPIVVVRPDDVFYPKVKVADVKEIVGTTVAGGEIIERLLYRNPVDGELIAHEQQIPFYGEQTRRIFGQNGYIDPVNLTDYLAIDGYAAMSKALLDMKPDEVIEEVVASGLRGRGGGGFLAGRKWRSCRAAAGEHKYVICNADEGDPGAFMDRSLLEGNPHGIIEGLIIGAWAIGADEGFVYVRHEYPLAVKRLEEALEQARAAGLLGDDILGSGFSFDIRISRGGGAFVCGESTALMASLEGQAGEPRAKYVHTVEQGLFDRPTTLNNVETWANVPPIILGGAAEYASIGSEGSKGTKIFSLVGQINNTGLVEVPMGITLREIVYGVGGGIPGGRKFKAVQTGGPSGGCIPEGMLGLEVDFQKLTEVGSMMGSGGMIVMDETTCMVDVARYFIAFLKEESCGKCVPCREGLKTALDILTRITEGRGVLEDIDLLLEIGDWMSASSLCALGGSAANPVASTIRYFRDEYEAHIVERRCPAGACRELITYSIDPEICNGCHACVKACPEACITGETRHVHNLDADSCIKCGACLSACRHHAISRK
ncbi:MAG: NADH-quinone oxidoreductase subunit F [bacterium]|nr:NADH-quinone oxidoreductase subunit F [bacterium]